MGYQYESGVLFEGGKAAARKWLFDEVRRRLRVKHYSLATERIYLQWIRRFIVANDRRHPREPGGVRAKAVLTHLYAESGVVGAVVIVLRGLAAEQSMTCWLSITIGAGRSARQ